MLLQNLVGHSASKVIQYLVDATPSINALEFFRYLPVPLLQQRAVLSSEANAIIEKAMALRKDCGLPFWDAVMLSCFESSGDLETLFDTCFHHQGTSESFVLLRDEIAGGKLDEIAADIRPSSGLAVNSRIVADNGNPLHLKLIDFHCASSSSNLSIARSVLQRLMPEGFVLLDSGKSFHGYGLSLQPQSDLAKFAAHALLFTPIVDRAYIAHRLIDGQFSLRVIGGLGGKPDPKVVYVEDHRFPQVNAASTNM